MKGFRYVSCYSVSSVALDSLSFGFNTGLTSVLGLIPWMIFFTNYLSTTIPIQGKFNFAVIRFICNDCFSRIWMKAKGNFYWI